MSIRNWPASGDTGAAVTASNVSAASTGVKRTYTCPAGKQAEVIWAHIFTKAGAATIQVRTTIGGVGAMVVLQTTTTVAQTLGFALNAGDTVDINVSVLDAAGSFDALICVREYPAT